MRTDILSSSSVKAAALPFLACSLLMSAQILHSQAPQTQPGNNSGFQVGAPKDDILQNTRRADANSSIQSQVSSPTRTVGPQRDGSIVVSDNQVLTPAGRLIELGAPVRAKAVALNPAKDAHTAAVLLMGSPQPIVVFDT